MPIDWLLIQNYDNGDDYLEMVRQSIEWSRDINKSIRVMLMLPFFAVKSKVGPLSVQEAANSLKRQGIASADISKGICRFS